MSSEPNEFSPTGPVFEFWYPAFDRLFRIYADGRVYVYLKDPTDRIQFEIGTIFNRIPQLIDHKIEEARRMEKFRPSMVFDNDKIDI